MRYKSFRIQNFKGIKDTTIELQGIAGANVFAFVGLNESGKTTVLEAIHSFSPDRATSELLGGKEGIGVPFAQRVPRHLISEFTDYVSVTATVTLTGPDKELIADYLLDSDLVADASSIPNEIIFQRRQKFENGDFVSSSFDLLTPIQIKRKRQKNGARP